METWRRIFFAIKLCDETKKLVAKLINQLQQERWAEYVRWTRLENLHITLRFIGRCEARQIANLIKQTEKMVKLINCFNIHLNSVQLFPNKYNPLALVIGSNPEAALFHLADAIEQIVVANGFSAEQRAFLPHLTLGRPIYKLNHVCPRFPNAHIDLIVNKIVLLSSELIDNKRWYSPIAEFDLCPRLPIHKVTKAQDC